MGLFSFLTGKKKKDDVVSAEKPIRKERSLIEFPYTAMAIETASKSSKSICRIAFIAFSKDGQEVARESIYIKPKGKTFSFSNINGITAADVANAPSFKEAWPRIEPYIKNSTIAVHFGHFAQKCLSACLKDAGISGISCNILDTKTLGEKMFPRLEFYNLADVSCAACGWGPSAKDSTSKALAISEIINYAAEKHPHKLKSVIYKEYLN